MTLIIRRSPATVLDQALSGQYFRTIIFLFTLPIALRSMLSTTFKTVGIL